MHGYGKLNRLMLWCSVFMLLPGCGLIRAHNEQVSARDYAVLTGRVSADYPLSGPILVGAWRENSDQDRSEGAAPGMPAFADYALLDASGNYVLLVPPGTYRVIAFEDANRNARIDAAEAASAYPAAARLNRNGMVAAIDVALKQDSRQNLLAAGTQLPARSADGMQSTRSGAVADLSAPFFSEAYAADTAYWEGLRFFREGGGNLFFMEPYDPARIPVLFVHGARGSPQDWKFAFQHLDTRRYQPCFFYYPTAMSLSDAANLLRMRLVDLQQARIIPRMHIVAHSAGGLLVRDFLRRYAAQHPYIDSFVSISTPWGGEPLAELGVKHSPVVLPAWIDMQPTSNFFAQLYRTPLPDTIAYYLLFGYRGSTPFRANNDGAILMESLLDARAQRSAREVRGFNESHVSILNSPEVFRELDRILKARDAAYQPEAPGLLHLQIADAAALGDVDSMTSLALQDAQGRTRSVALPQSASATLSGVPAGDYRLRVRSLRVRMQPDELPVTVQADASTTAVLPLQARQGSICGVALRANEEYAAAGLKAAIPVEITQVQLRGPGIARSIATRYAGPDDAPLTQDFITPGLFCFVDLPDGEYSIELQSPSGSRTLTTRLPVKGWNPLMVYF